MTNQKVLLSSAHFLVEIPDDPEPTNIVNLNYYKARVLYSDDLDGFLSHCHVVKDPPGYTLYFKEYFGNGDNPDYGGYNSHLPSREDCEIARTNKCADLTLFSHEH